eukprot:UN18579
MNKSSYIEGNSIFPLFYMKIPLCQALFNGYRKLICNNK